MEVCISDEEEDGFRGSCGSTSASARKQQEKQIEDLIFSMAGILVLGFFCVRVCVEDENEDLRGRKKIVGKESGSCDFSGVSNGRFVLKGLCEITDKGKIPV